MTLLKRTTKSRNQNSLKANKPHATKYAGKKEQKQSNMQKTNRTKAKKRSEENHAKVSRLVSEVWFILFKYHITNIINSNLSKVSEINTFDRMTYPKWYQTFF